MIGSFGSKQFEVSYYKIYTPDGTAIAEGLDYEEQSRAGDKPLIYIKGLKNMSVFSGDCQGYAFFGSLQPGYCKF